MFNDYGVANIVWQRQREAERVAAAYRLSLLAERGARSAAVVGGGSSLAARLARRIAHIVGAVVIEVGRLPEYAAEAERLHREMRRAAADRPETQRAGMETVRAQATVRLQRSGEQASPGGGVVTNIASVR